MKTHIDKADVFSPAFTTDGCLVIVKPATIVAGHALDQEPVLLEGKVPGTDFEILVENGKIILRELSGLPSAGAIGGFHLGLDNAILENSIWDCKFRPKAKDPRGMVLVPGVGWVDIYLLGKNPSDHGTSRAGVEIHNGITWWQAVEALAKHEKQLLSIAEFYFATQGVEENRTADSRPESASHIEGLKSRYGIEQATGCLWTWGRDFDPVDSLAVLLGGNWYSAGAGPRRWSYGRPDVDWYSVGARGRCDHLIPDGSEAKA